MKSKLFTALMAIMTLVACQSADEDATVENNGMAQVGFNLAGEFQVEDGALSRAVTPECYYIAVSQDTPVDGKISSGYAGYFTSLSSATLALPKGEYTFYISAFKSAGYTIDWTTDYSSLTEGSFTEVTTPIAYAPSFADQKVDRYYGKVTQPISQNTTVTVDGKRFAYGINVNIAAPLEGKVTVSSTSPAFSYTVNSTDAAKVEQNIFCLAGEDPATASKSTTVTMNIYDASNNVVATNSKTITIARNHSKTIKVSAVDPKASFAFNVEDGDMTNDGDEDLTPKETHAYVDLGLSVKWATMNVGATEVAGTKINSHTGQKDCYGEYYAWGETSPKDSYTWSNLKYCSDPDNLKFTKYVATSSYGTVDNKTTLELSDDAAHANWGGTWRMPTTTEQQELLDNCYWEWTTSYNNTGVKGYIVYKVKNSADKGKKNNTSSSSQTPTASYSLSDNHIFLPAAGYRDVTGLGGVGSYGLYWSSSLDSGSSDCACYLYFGSDYVGWGYSSRCSGASVRPVCP